MRLSKLIKSQAIDNILNTLDIIDYRDIAHDTIQRDAKNQLPKELKELLQDKEKAKGIAPYIRTHFHHTRVQGVGSVCIMGNDSYTMSYETELEIDRIRSLMEQQSSRLRRVTEHLNAVFDSCSTLAQLGRRYPEFIEYVPQPDERPANLPATTELMDNLKALGWNHE